MPPKAGDGALPGASRPSPGSKESSSPQTNQESASPPAKKARTSVAAAGSRGVANLTPEQLAKKRANDREAQRAIRERTRSQIETLEHRIQELTNQQPYQELQQAIRQKELVEAENAEIKRRLHAVMGLIQPLLEGNAMTGLSTPALDDHRAEFARSSIATVFGANGSNDPYSPSSATTADATSIASRQYPTPQYSAPWAGSMPTVNDTAMAHTNPMGNMRSGRPAESVTSMMRTTSAERMALGMMPVGRTPLTGSPTHISGSGGGSHVVHEPTASGRRVSLPSDSHITLGRSASGGAETTSPTTGQSASPPNPTAHAHPHGHPHAPVGSDAFRGSEHPPTWSALPPHSGPTCPLDGILLDFLAERRRLAATGASDSELVGPPYPDFTYFVLPAGIRKQRRAAHPLSQMLTDVILTFPDIKASPEKVATYYGMYLVLRWLAHPTQAHYDRLLPFNRPTSWQQMTVHPPWIDSVPWPAMRNILVREHARYPFDEFFVPFTKTMSVNWPYPDLAVFRTPPPPPPQDPQDDLGPDLEISPVFEDHIRDLNNWSLGSTFAQAFPLLALPDVRFIDHPLGEDKE